jgi:hypothetical protein
MQQYHVFLMKLSLWPHGMTLHSVVGSSVTDAAAPCISPNFSKQIRVTRVGYALRRVSETIRVLYPNVDRLEANGNNIVTCLL